MIIIYQINLIKQISNSKKRKKNFKIIYKFIYWGEDTFLKFK